MRKPESFQLVAFDSGDDPLSKLQELPQGQYLRCYLADLGARSVLVEPMYFDRDYLSEFAAFYCTSAAGYPNVCSRAHYFSSTIDRGTLEAAVGGDATAHAAIQESYLGFVVRRPIPKTPIGRTVLRWYPDDQTPQLPRVVEPSRDYKCNVAGLELQVKGLAWQQQDVGVGACATVALWSMLHSSAFDDRHVVPTTAEVTRAAHGPGLSEHRAFPSNGLSFAQLVATVRDSGFAPLVIPGDRAIRPGAPDGFTREHFCASLAAFVRSGYPVLIAGMLLKPGQGRGLLEHGRHAVCAVGFRQASSKTPSAGELEFEDEHTEYVHIHDDNLGPAARFRIEVNSKGTVLLRASPPKARHSLTLTDPTRDYPVLRPSALLAAAHDDVRLSPDVLHRQAIGIGTALIAATGGKLGLTVSARFTRLSRYVQRELGAVLQGKSLLIARTRLALCETVPPMSLHLGVVRFGVGPVPLLDVLFDTTDSEPNMQAFCHVAYHRASLALAAHLGGLGVLDLGVAVEAC